MDSTVSSKGQVTIPIAVRHRLGLRPGDAVEFVFVGGEVVLRPARGKDNPFEADLGMLPAFQSREEINAWVAGMRDED